MCRTPLVFVTAEKYTFNIEYFTTDVVTLTCRFFIYVFWVVEAVDAILAFTGSAAELLRRKKMKRDILFRYLYGEGISVAPSADKSTIVRRVLEHWGSTTSSEDDNMLVSQFYSSHKRFRCCLFIH